MNVYFHEFRRNRKNINEHEIENQFSIFKWFVLHGSWCFRNRIIESSRKNNINN
jgi:hypothetical protein